MLNPNAPSFLPPWGSALGPLGSRTHYSRVRPWQGLRKAPAARGGRPRCRARSGRQVAPGGGLLPRVVPARWTGRRGANHSGSAGGPRSPTPSTQRSRQVRRGGRTRAAGPAAFRARAPPPASLEAPGSPAARSPKTATMEAQAQGEWSPIVLRVASWRSERRFPAPRNFALGRSGWVPSHTSATLRSCPRLRDKSLLPKLGICCEAGASRDAKWRGLSAGNAPTECSTSFPSQCPLLPLPRVPNLASARRTCCAGSGIREAFPLPLGEQEGSATPLGLSRGLASRPEFELGGARWGGGCAETRGSRLRQGLAQPGLAFSGGRALPARDLQAIDACAPVSQGRGATSASSPGGARRVQGRSPAASIPAPGVARCRSPGGGVTKGSLGSWGHTGTRGRESV